MEIQMRGAPDCVRKRTYAASIAAYPDSSFHYPSGVSMRPVHTSVPALVLAAAGLLLCASQAFAAGTGIAAEAQVRYRQDMAMCNSGQSNQDAKTCRLEARNALAEGRRGALTSVPEALASNARLRCNAHEGDARSACEARMRGEGTTSSGSVRSGGILRETVTVVPGG